MSTLFRWKRYDDGSGEPWSRWHAQSGSCPGCCCNGPLDCADCGGREHQEPGEPLSTFDVVHISYCQGCREDLIGDEPELEEQHG